MYKCRFLFFYFLLMQLSVFSQENHADSSITMEEVIVSAFEQTRSRSINSINVKIIRQEITDRNNKLSLVHSFNTIAGVRMEERSPGSYRINIRGGSIRSPFGVRNVKVYWNQIPVTDPGGNTYFNQFATNSFSSIDIHNGPVSSMYGAGTGGLILMRSFDERWEPSVSLELLSGSFGLKNLFTTINFGEKNNRNSFSYAHNKTDGYRDHTNMQRDNFSWTSDLKFSEKHQVTTGILFTDLFYQTPGALTLAQFNANPKSSRPAGGGLPGAVATKAAIYQKNFLAGITHQYKIDESWSFKNTLYGAYAHIKNPSIRNYERRSEPHFGGRSSITWHKNNERDEWKWIIGSEMQWAYFNTQVFKNKNGNPDTLQTNDDIIYKLKTYFTQLDYSYNDKWFFSTGISSNFTAIEITRLNKYPIVPQQRNYSNELAPRLSISHHFTEQLSIQTSISKGFSPPTLSELLPSTGVISTNLEAETGTNYEAGGKLSLLQNKLTFFLNAFHFKISNALVQRRDLSGADFFINAGNTKQKGLELNAHYVYYSPEKSFFINTISLNGSYAYSNFKYGDLKKDTVNFSGKFIPGVPVNAVSCLMDIQFKKELYCNFSYYYNSKQFINDANNAFADPYHLLGFRLGWNKNLLQKMNLNLYFGIDNLLNEVYSLGNDINDPRGRAYNAAAGRNYYTGIAFKLVDHKKK